MSNSELPFLESWRKSLQGFVDWYDRRNQKKPVFFLSLFLLFTLFNITCFWIATKLNTPELIADPVQFSHLKRVQFPVGILGAFFDCLSLIVTATLIRWALKKETVDQIVKILSLEAFVTVFASVPIVILVFSLSGWIAGNNEGIKFSSKSNTQQHATHNMDSKETSAISKNSSGLSGRFEVYQSAFLNIIQKPGEYAHHIYFGLIVALSTLLPSLIHLFLLTKAYFRTSDPTP